MQAKINKVVKQKRPGMQYKVVMYDDLLDVIRDEVLEAGLTLVPHDCLHVASTPYDRIGNSGAVHMNREVYVFTFRLYHVPSGEFLQLSTPGDGVDEMDKGPGKALTYATKTAWEKLLMLARGDAADPDGRPSQQQRTQQAPQQRQAAPPAAQQNGQPASKLTYDPQTWPAPYPGMYARDLEGFKDAEAINRFDDWSAMNSLDFFEKYTADKGFPADVRYWYIRGIAIRMLAVALASKHAIPTVRAIREHKDRFSKILGEDTFKALVARAEAEEKKAATL